MRRLFGMAVLIVLVATSIVAVCWLLRCYHRPIPACPAVASGTTAGDTLAITSDNISVLQAETFEWRLRLALMPLARYEITYDGDLGRNSHLTSAVLGRNANSWDVCGVDLSGEPAEVPLYATIELVGITTDVKGNLAYAVTLRIPDGRTEDELKELVTTVRKLGTVSVTRF